MKTVSRKPTYAEIYMYKNLFWLDIGILIFLPVLNNLFLQLIRLYTDGNIAYGSLGAVMAAVQEAISLFSGYAGIGILCVCMLYFGKKRRRSDKIVRYHARSDLFDGVADVFSVYCDNTAQRYIFASAGYGCRNCGDDSYMPNYLRLCGPSRNFYGNSSVPFFKRYVKTPLYKGVCIGMRMLWRSTAFDTDLHNGF